MKQFSIKGSKEKQCVRSNTSKKNVFLLTCSPNVHVSEFLERNFFQRMKKRVSEKPFIYVLLA